MAREMKTCPFCGGDNLVPSFHRVDQLFIVCVSCADCDAEGPPATIREDRAEAIELAHERWNNRN